MITLPKVYSQRDERWNDKMLGFSTVSTLGSYGCIVTCLAMIARYFGKETDPDRMNEDLKSVDGFQGNVYYRWSSLAKIYPDIKFTEFVNTPTPVTLAQFTEIDAHLEKGFPVMLKVDYNPATTFVEQHFVLLVGKVGNSYKIADPWTGTIESFTAKYGTAKYAIQRFILYEGPIPEGGGDDMPSQAEFDDLRRDVDNLDQTKVPDLVSGLVQVNERVDEIGPVLERVDTTVSAIPDVSGDLVDIRGEIQKIKAKLEKSGIPVGNFGLLDRMLFEISELWRVVKKAIKGGEK